MDDEHIYKSHNKTLLMCHLVFPLKYRKKVITEKSGKTLVNICLEISERYEIEFIEIGYEPNHVHFLVQSVPKMSVSKMVRTIKSIIAREMFRQHPEIKSLLWGGRFWTSGFYANTVGLYAGKLRARSSAPLINAGDVSMEFILDERARELFVEEERLLTLMRT